MKSLVVFMIILKEQESPCVCGLTIRSWKCHLFRLIALVSFFYAQPAVIQFGQLGVAEQANIILTFSHLIKLVW